MKTLADTSVWIDHFRYGNKTLIDLLERDEILIHPLIIGELACGNLKNRKTILEDLSSLSAARNPTFEETLSVVEEHHFYGKGIGYIDAQLLSVCLLNNAQLFTLDKKLDRLFKNL